MKMNLAVTTILSLYRIFSKLFWLGYKVLEKLHPDFESIKMNLLRSKRIDPKYYLDLPNYQLEVDLLNKEWEDKSEEAKQLGTSTHEYIHNLLCTNPSECKSEFAIPTDKYSIELNILKSGIFVELRLEWPLEYDNLLVGVPDLFVIHDGVIDIKDWKVLDEAPKFKSMYEVSKHTTKKLKFPLSLIDDANGIVYLLQLSIYMWMILKLRPDLSPGKLELVWIKDNKIKKSFEVLYLQKEVDRLILWHVKRMHLEQECKKCREIQY